jgi:hypothetical protein
MTKPETVDMEIILTDHYVPHNCIKMYIIHFRADNLGSTHTPDPPGVFSESSVYYIRCT